MIKKVPMPPIQNQHLEKFDAGLVTPELAGRPACWATAGVGILNGVFGDYLQHRRNGLALLMSFMQQRY